MTEAFNERVALAEIRGFLDGAPLPPPSWRDLRPELTEEERLAAIEKLRLSTLSLRRMRLEHAQAERDMRKAEKEVSVLHESMSALEELVAWMEQPPRFEECRINMLPRFVNALNTGKVPMVRAEEERQRTEIEGYLEGIQTFVVERDWASLFANAEGFNDGQIMLPAAHCAFVFHISGRHVIALMDGRSYLAISQGPGGFWCIAASGKLDLSCPASGEPHLNAVMWRQIRATSIMLDAQVAEREVMRAPVLASKAGALLDPELYDYNIVSLRRAAYSSLPSQHTGRRKRLHFRRGHWVHYTSHKTWRRWCLAGGAELGWVDKEYRV